MRVPVGFINASGVGRGAMVERGLPEKLSSSGESSLNESSTRLGKLVDVASLVVLGLSVSEEPKNENLLLEVGTLKFGANLGGFLAFDGPTWVSV
jgi:hypothetical protein